MNNETIFNIFKKIFKYSSNTTQILQCNHKTSNNPQSRKTITTIYIIYTYIQGKYICLYKAKVEEITREVFLTGSISMPVADSTEWCSIDNNEPLQPQLYNDIP